MKIKLEINKCDPIKLTSFCTGKETIKQTKKTTYRMEDNICNWCYWQWLNLQIIQSMHPQSLSYAQLFFDPMDCSPPGSSVHGIFQAKILEWVAISFSRGSSWPMDWTCVSLFSCNPGRFFITETLGKLLNVQRTHTIQHQKQIQTIQSKNR